MILKRYYILILFFCITFPPLFCESSQTYEMDLFMNMIRLTKGEWIFGYSGSADIKFKSKGEKKVKGEIDLELFSPDLLSLKSGTSLAALQVKKMYIKANFILNKEKSHVLKWTIGKTRLSWGEGFVFNSGDILFGSLSPYLDFTENKLRDDSAWLTALNFQLAPFVFLEFVAMPPKMDLGHYLELSLPGTDESESAQLLSDYELPHISQSSIGTRLYAEIGKNRYLKLETGYMYMGESKVVVAEVLDKAMHRIYFGLEGNRFFNWQITSSVSFPVENIDTSWDLVGQLWSISGGLSYIHSLNSESSISFRLESLWVPFGFWSNPTTVEKMAEPGRGLGVLLYPELAYSPINSLNLVVRSMISPIDASGQFSFGIDWNVYQGLNILLFSNFNGGNENSTFAWDRGEESIFNASSTGFSIMTGMRYKF